MGSDLGAYPYTKPLLDIDAIVADLDAATALIANAQAKLALLE